LRKPNSIRFVLILSLIFSLTGCSREYQSERHLYRATKLAKNILLAPDTIPPQEFNRAVDAYKSIFEKYPDTWSAKRARIALGSLYLSKKEFEKARAYFNRALEASTDNKNLCMEAQFAIAKSYENEGLWDKALIEYQKIMKDYPDSEMALALPLYIASKNKDYASAIAYYAKIREENPKTLLGFKAENLIVTCYMKQDDWDNAVSSLERLAMDYPMARTIELTMRMILDICRDRLNAPERAISFFEKFLQEYPDHALKDSLNKGLEVLKNAATVK
jgi:tetratricopeptide (TPR) repeat protein